MSVPVPLRHVVSINDLSDADIENIFLVADSYLAKYADPNVPYRIGRSSTGASDLILATLFYEPSTRTRLSFESAMLRLGGKVITSADPATSSAAKGESIADTVRVIGNYADAIVIRHPKDGAARLAADYSPVPVINGGDGSHEHPTQTLCDIFTLRKKNKTLRNLNIAISGDLKGSRTIHSFVYALARSGANILMMPAKGMELPAHVDNRLREEFRCRMVGRDNYEADDASIDALYVTPEEPHQLSLISDVDIDINIKIKKKIDAVYVTRFQKERWKDAAHSYPTIDAKFLKQPRYSEASVLHPLPRVGELDLSVDSDERAMYFQQAAYGVPVRMALISLLLDRENAASLERFSGGFDRKLTIYDQPIGCGIQCTNSNCIVCDPLESKYARNKFYLVGPPKARKPKIRCAYCDTEINRFVIANKRTKSYTNELNFANLGTQIKDVVIFQNESKARSEGFHPAKHFAA